MMAAVMKPRPTTLQPHVYVVTPGVLHRRRLDMYEVDVLLNAFTSGPEAPSTLDMVEAERLLTRIRDSRAELQCGCHDSPQQAPRMHVHETAMGLVLRNAGNPHTEGCPFARIPRERPGTVARVVALPPVKRKAPATVDAIRLAYLRNNLIATIDPLPLESPQQEEREHGRHANPDRTPLHR